MSSSTNHYEVLGVSKNASQAEIKKAYKALARSLHPDKNKYGTPLMKKVNAAYEVLSDPDARKKYDRNRSSSKENSERSGNRNGSGNTNRSYSAGFNAGRSKGYDTGFKTGKSAGYSAGYSAGSKQRKPSVFLNSVKCTVCGNIVNKDFYEAPCCGALCCIGCTGKPSEGSPFKCQNELCSNPRLVGPPWCPDFADWKTSSKFINAQIDKHVKIRCDCGARFLSASDKAKHQNECTLFNTKCFKCKGTGKSGLFGGCSACFGRKFLKGTNWIECFKCRGRGAYKAYQGQTQCNTCKGIGGLKGQWTVCFKCLGIGAFRNNYNGAWDWIDCKACGSAGAFRGYHLRACPKCDGGGCETCIWNGTVPCNCGIETCRGHTHECVRYCQAKHFNYHCG